MSDSSATGENDQRLHDILASYLEAQRQGQAPPRAVFLARYPEHAADLAAFLDDQAALARVAPPPAMGETVGLGETAPPTGTRVGYFGDYELQQEIARGGMGVVYRARQLSLNRAVALKMILSGQFASAQEVQRFRAEAEAAAGLDHPNILPIYEVGEYQGHQYFSMKLVDGGSLAAALDRSPRPPLRTLVGLLVQVCRGVHFAHQRGILHRDLKPANVLLQTDSGATAAIPLVTDFGLAKRVEGDSQLTQSGAIVGTPAYMAPEQAAGRKQLTTGVDVWSLGAILYEMLTGRPPFRGVTPLETLLQVMEQEPARPRSLDARADRDLETICLKCLDKDPGRRYGSAEALADDLQRWLDGVPITARPTGVAERAAKWVRRRPAVAALLAAILLTAAVGVAGIGWQWRRAEKARDIALDAQQQALLRAADAQQAWHQETEARKTAEVARGEEAQAKVAAQQAQVQEAAARTAAEEARKQAEAQRDAKERAFTRGEGLRLAAEADAARFRDPGLALLLAIEGVKRTPGHLTFTSLYGALNDCREVRTLGDGGREEQGWHIFEREVRQARWFPDGRRVLAMAGASLRSYDPVSGKVLWEWPGWNLPLSGAAFDPEGRRVVLTAEGYAPVRHSDDKFYNYTDRLAYVVDLATGRELHRLRGATSTLVSAEFSGDGKQIVTACWDGAARLYDAASGKRLQTFKPESKALLREFTGDKSLLLARFTPDGKHVLTVTTNDSRFSYSYDDPISGNDKAATDPDYDADARPLGPSGRGYGSASVNLNAETVLAHLWDAATGKQVAGFEQAPPPGSTGHAWKPQAAAIAPDGAAVALAMEGIVPVYETQTGQARCTLTGHAGTVHSVAFSPDSQRIVTGGADQTVRLWDAATGKELLRLRGHTSDVRGVGFDRTGKRLASWASDGTARVWDAESGVEKATLRGHSGSVAGADFSPDGHFLVTAGDKTARVWRLDDPPLPDKRLTGHTGKATALAYSPDGKRAVTVSPDQTARLWDTATGQELRVLGQGRNLGEVRMARFSPDGQRLVTAASHRSVQSGDRITTSAVLVWDVATGEELLALRDLDTGAQAAYFSPDGAHILTVGDGYYRVKKDTDKKEPKQVGGIAFSIESGSTADAGRVQLWDAATGKLLVTVPGKKNEGYFSSNDFYAPAFSPDGKRLVIYDANERQARLLDAATGKALAELYRPRGYGQMHFLFTPDGKQVIVTRGGSLGLHDAATGAAVARLQDFANSISQTAVSADGKRLVTATGTRAYVWDLERRALLATLLGHEAGVLSVAFSPDGQQIVTGAGDQTAALWDAATGTLLALYRGHAGAVQQVAFRPDGQQVATVGADGTARLWPADLWTAVLPRRPRALNDAERQRYELPAEGKPKPTWQERVPQFETLPPPPEPFVLATTPTDPEGERKASALLTALRQESKQPAELREQVLELRRTYPATAAAVEAARLLTTLPGPLAALDPKQIPEAERLDGQPPELVAVLGQQHGRHWGWIDHVGISSTGRVVVTHGFDNLIRVWDPQTLAARGRIAGQRFWLIGGRDEIAVRTEDGLTFWDIAGPEPQVRTVAKLGRDGYVCAVSPDGKRAAAVGPTLTSILLCDLVRTPPVRTTIGKLAQGHGIGAGAFSPDGRWLALQVETTGELHLYDLKAADTIAAAVFPFEGERLGGLAFSPDSRWLAGSYAGKVRLCDLTAAKVAVGAEIPAPNLLGIQFLPDGKLLTGISNAPARLWDVSGAAPREAGKVAVNSVTSNGHAFSRDGQRVFSSKGCVLRAWERDGDQWRELDPPRGPTDAIYALAFAPDDRTLYAADGSETLRLWGLAADAFQERHAERGVGYHMLLSADGRQLLAGNRDFSIWDVTGPQPQRRTGPTDAQQYGPVRMALSADGRLLARGGNQPALSLFDLTGPEPKRRLLLDKLPEAQGRVESVALSPDGRLLATFARESQANDNVLRLWRVTDTDLKPMAFPWIEGFRAAFSPDGRTLAVSQRDGVHLWDLTPSVPKERLHLDKLPNYGGLYFRWSPAGDRIVGWYDRTLMIWDTASGKALHQWTWPGEFNAVALAHDGRHLAIGNANATVYVLRIPGE